MPKITINGWYIIHQKRGWCFFYPHYTRKAWLSYLLVLVPSRPNNCAWPAQVQGSPVITIDHHRSPYLIHQWENSLHISKYLQIKALQFIGQFYLYLIGKWVSILQDFFLGTEPLSCLSPSHTRRIWKRRGSAMKCWAVIFRCFQVTSTGRV